MTEKKIKSSCEPTCECEMLMRNAILWYSAYVFIPIQLDIFFKIKGEDF